MSYSAETMAALAEQLYVVHVERSHGPTGIDRLQKLLVAVKDLYRFRSPQSFYEGLVVFSALEEDADLLAPDDSRVLEGAEQAVSLPAGAVLQVLQTGRLRAWPAGAAAAQELVDSAVVYVFSQTADENPGGLEAIVLPDGVHSVPNPNGYPSALAPPTFWNLEDALDHYATNMAARSTCKILKTVWAIDSENRRLVLRNTPEVVMRESLTQHLRSSVRDAKLVRVNEEQNVSETKPVDIEIIWSLTSHVALVEVKWMGKCLNESGDRLASYSYSDARAREGARQLDGYIDESYERNPGHEIKGYLVVLDARRWGVTTWEPGPITREHAWHFKDKDIDFEEAIPEREEFQPPRRVFLEPRVAA